VIADWFWPLAVRQDKTGMKRACRFVSNGADDKLTAAVQGAKTGAVACAFPIL
jgi:hypothetical protein